ncbi:thymocyte nuclear protein 1-like isoform X2 [Varroa jacobsoni]|uniref:Thymocyte nuclear protein 1 n=1 Tax=Varroa destructor TaxID=109461 RepID=A0A7M7KU61_VARDE|nr:thymocyte nuclear protein 1-like isoform X2 [Varroa destructor]XP_022670751.1 thymocyte nuclear protein 1-like isoform X2 [Varroa destructor]XP_022670752.1 thymocyte nuclear protein 1-like isoform X2 [Varroa destructor]XP_022670753.1 thymocyte nuclear protein 1-like isoform X2 [Varroa destructor]XP_022694405.1 thymocyte nuclear protein 1-like isoform X2 [Varroa jacobsoni]XP_022694406.1 thymocyte nuclear protein 1-like isoform X2 [Varroa jacobsoni]XP_022694407.1 thymocyte nuclear protein 1-
MPRGRKRIADASSMQYETAIPTKTLKVTSKKSKDPSKEYSHFTHWLVKSEGESRIENGHDFKFSIDDLANSKNQTTHWEGVRNYQARNFMRDFMKLGQQVFFYHSNVKEPGIVGLVEITKESYPDHTQFEKGNHYFDKSASKDNPRWFMVDIKLVRHFKRCITLKELKRWHLEHKKNNGPLKDLFLFTKARLSVLPISDKEWEFICKLEDQEPFVD